MLGFQHFFDLHLAARFISMLFDVSLSLSLPLLSLCYHYFHIILAFFTLCSFHFVFSVVVLTMPSNKIMKIYMEMRIVSTAFVSSWFMCSTVYFCFVKLNITNCSLYLLHTHTQIHTTFMTTNAHSAYCTLECFQPYTFYGGSGICILLLLSLFWLGLTRPGLCVASRFWNGWLWQSDFVYSILFFVLALRGSFFVHYNLYSLAMNKLWKFLIIWTITQEKKHEKLT